MTFDYQTAWTKMNDLEQALIKISQVKDVIDAASEALRNSYRASERLKAESLCNAASDYLELLLDSVDEKFQAAWKVTVAELNTPPDPVAWRVRVESDGVTGLFIELPSDLRETLGIHANDELEIIHEAQSKQTTIQKI